MESRTRQSHGLLLHVVLFSFLSMLMLSGCGGGGTTASSSTAGTSDIVRFTMAAATEFPAAGLSASPAPDAAPASSRAVSANQGFDVRHIPAPQVDHAWITVQKIALIGEPSMNKDEARDPDPEGEESVEDNDMDDRPFVSAKVSPPMELDLMNLPAEQFSLLMAEIPNPPAGTYGKIRLYYSNPKVHIVGEADNTAIRGTANYHLDIRFVGDKLVIPEGADAALLRTIQIEFFLGRNGLKISVHRHHGTYEVYKIKMRPQVFAKVAYVQPKPVQRQVVTGIISNVLTGPGIQGSFDLTTADGRLIHVRYADTAQWFLRYPDHQEPTTWYSVISMFMSGIEVDVTGVESPDGTIQAEEIRVAIGYATDVMI